MDKRVKSVLFALVLIISFSQVTYAKNEELKPPKPTIGTESSDKDTGSSNDVEIISEPSTRSSLLTDWSCSVSNNQNISLYLVGQQNANSFMDEMKLTLYLQRWEVNTWVDIACWSFYEFNTTSQVEDASSAFEHGNYYRARAEHYAEDGSQTDTAQSTSSYIYVQ